MDLGISGLKTVLDYLPEDSKDPAVQNARREAIKTLELHEKTVARTITVDSTTPGKKFTLTAEWMNAAQITWFINKNPEYQWHTFANAKFIGMEHALGYPGFVYHFPPQLEFDDIRIKNILHPSGGPGLGKSWWYKPVQNPEEWWTTVARPYYAELYKRNLGETWNNAIVSLGKQTRESIENGTFPFTER